MSARRTNSLLFFAIEVNLILWLVLLGCVLGPDRDFTVAKYVAYVGTAFAAIVQHWAYYAVRRTKQTAQ